MCPVHSISSGPLNLFIKSLLIWLDNAQESPSSDTPADFETFYLQQVTQEFADDLDKLRNASDFNEKSLPVLIAALKQGAKLYSEEELGDGLRLQ